MGFIGGGLSSAVGKTHYSASQLDGNWELVAGVFSQDPEINRATAQAWHVQQDRTYRTWSELISEERNNLDAVVVLLPTPDHQDVLCELFKAQIPVICEKALVSSLDEIKELSEEFNPEKNFLAVTYNYSGYPMVRELREIIGSGEIGTIQQIHFEMPQEGFVRPPDIAGKPSHPQSWRLTDQHIPTICLDLGVHLHHLAHFLTGDEPSSLIADFENYSQYSNLVDNVRMWLRYNSGMTASFWMSKTAIGRRNGLRLRVFGDQGSAEWYQLDSEQLLISSMDGTQRIIDRGCNTYVCSQARYNRMKVGHPSGFIEAFANIYHDIAEALDEWKANKYYSNPYVFGLRHAQNGLQLFQYARDSFDHGAWKSLDL